MKLTHGLLFVSVAFCLTPSRAQFPLQNPGRADLHLGHRWDAAHGVLFLGKNFLLRKTGPLLRAFNEDGSRYGADIDLFKDFPGLVHAHVDDFAAGPAGTTLIAALLNYGSRHLKNVILTYDSHGNLRSMIETAPYAADAITTDDRGDIFVLGERIDEHEGDPPYPLLIEYDSSGRVIGSFLRSDAFKTGTDAIRDFGPGDELVSPSLALLDGRFYVYAPSEHQLRVLSSDGRTLRRASLEDVATNIARTDNVNRAAISEVAFVDENHAVLYLTESVVPDEPGVRDYSNLHAAVYLVDLATKQFKFILRGEAGANPAFVGVKDGQLLTVSAGPEGLEFHRHDLF